MKKYGIILELNPLHMGHEYFLEEVRKIAAKNYVIAAISTFAVQRGEFSVLDVQTKTKMLLDLGVDLVIGMPTYYTNQGGKFFGYNAVKILNDFGVEEIICGSETGDLSYIKNNFEGINEKCIAESKGKHRERKKFKEGYLHEQMGSLKSNDILALSYYQGIQEINDQIQLTLVKRRGGEHKKLEADDGYLSASAIREFYRRGDFTEELRELLEKNLSEESRGGLLTFNEPILLELLRYRMIVMPEDEKRKIFLSENGELVKKLEKVLHDFLGGSIRELCQLASDKNNSKYKYQRICLNILLGILVHDEDSELNNVEKYWVLGFTERFRKELKQANNYFTQRKEFTNLYEEDEKIISFLENLNIVKRNDWELIGEKEDWSGTPPQHVDYMLSSKPFIK